MLYSIGKSTYSRWKDKEGEKKGVDGSKAVINMPNTAGYDSSKPTLSDSQLKDICDKINSSVGYIYNSTSDMEAAFAELNNDADVDALIVRFGMGMKNEHGVGSAGLNLPDFMSHFYTNDVDAVNAAMKAKGINRTI